MEKTRDELKNKFKKGEKPTEVDYANLMDSYVNKLEDPYFKFNELPLATKSKEGITKPATLSEVENGVDNSNFVSPKVANEAILSIAPKPPVTKVNGKIGEVEIPDYTKDISPFETIALNSGISNAAATTPGYQKKIGLVFLEGEISITSSTLGDIDLFTLKSSYRPSREITFYVVASNASTIKIKIEVNGKVSADKSGTISLAGISFIAA